MKKLLRTIGQTALLFGDSDRHCYEQMESRPENFIYCGKLADVSEALARTFVGIHPSFPEYYEIALATIWQGRGLIFKHGSESVLQALASYAEFKGKSYPWVWVWKPFEQPEE